MSALPQKRTLIEDVRMSALCLSGHMRRSKISLVDDLVGELVELQRNGQVERLRSCAIYYEME